MTVQQLLDWKALQALLYEAQAEGLEKAIALSYSVHPEGGLIGYAEWEAECRAHAAALRAELSNCVSELQDVTPKLTQNAPFDMNTVCGTVVCGMRWSKDQLLAQANADLKDLTTTLKVSRDQRLDAEAKLAQMTTERDQYKEYSRLANATMDSIMQSLKQQLAERDERIKQLEGGIEP
jgi:hypothetical protein